MIAKLCKFKTGVVGSPCAMPAMAIHDQKGTGGYGGRYLR
jgi:hypothetical protein